MNILVQQEIRNCESSLDRESTRARHARTMIDLVRIVRFSPTPKSYIASLVRAKTNLFRATTEQRAAEIVEDALRAVEDGMHHSNDFETLRARFIADTQELCRGYFPAAYRKAEIRLAKITADARQRIHKDVPH